MKPKLMVLSAVFASVLLTGCGGGPHGQGMKQAMHSIMMRIEAVQAKAEDAHHMAVQAKEAAATADEVARMAASCCDANTHRLNSEFHGSQSK